MTDSKSVDNYRFMPAKPFVMNNRTYCLIDGIQFIIYTIAPNKTMLTLHISVVKYHLIMMWKAAVILYYAECTKRHGNIY